MRRKWSNTSDIKRTQQLRQFSQLHRKKKKNTYPNWDRICGSLTNAFNKIMYLLPVTKKCTRNYYLIRTKERQLETLEEKKTSCT